MRRGIWPLWVALAFLVACSNESKGPSVDEYAKARAAKQSAPAPKKAGPAEQAAPEEEAPGALVGGYAYSPVGKRDPFRSFVLDEVKERRVGRGPLEQFDLGQLKVVAVVWSTGRARALVQDPSGRGYIVQQGTPIGKNDGRITQISDGEVVVKETYVDYLGEQTTKDIALRIRPRQGG
jgi:type IV pilus assembly protein PilP